MAATTAILGYDTKVAIEDDNSPAAFVELVEVISVTPPNQQVDQVEATHMQSTNRTREFIAGLNDPGECELEMNWVPGSVSDARLLALKSAGTYKNVKITFPNLVTWTFLAAVTGYEPQTPIDDRATVSVMLRVSGATTIVVP